MDPPSKREKGSVVDLVSYKIKKQIRQLHPDCVERKITEAVLELYESNVVDVKWVDEDMMVSMRDGSNIPEDLLSFVDDEELHVTISHVDDEDDPE